MKKSIFIAVIGVAASVASSYGQGFIQFSSYGQTAANAITTTSSGNVAIGVPFIANLYYFIGTISDPVSGSDPTSITAAPTGFTLLASAAGGSAAYDNSGAATGAGGLGYFDGALATIPGYSSGPITFEVVAFNGADYADSLIRGRSGSFTMTSIRTDGVASSFGDNGTPMPAFVVAPVPEPTTLALAGLGGLASLVAMRRKNA